MGEHPAMKERARYQRVAATDSTVLLLGESGTGKELFARAIHHSSPRARTTVRGLECAAIPEGWWKTNCSDTSAAHTRRGRAKDREDRAGASRHDFPG